MIIRILVIVSWFLFTFCCLPKYYPLALSFRTSSYRTSGPGRFKWLCLNIDHSFVQKFPRNNLRGGEQHEYCYDSEVTDVVALLSIGTTGQDVA